MTPDDFKMPLIEEAYRQRHWALSHSRSHKLDPQTSLWIIRVEAWREFQLSADFVKSISIGPKHRLELLGLPVRLTINDEPDVPMIQLVMEPMISPTAPRPSSKAQQ